MPYAINYLNTLAVHFFSCVLAEENAEILVTQLQTTINYEEMGEGVTLLNWERQFLEDGRNTAC